MKPNFDKINTHNHVKNPSNYKWGVFYFDKKDKRVIFPKYESSRGWTINFANPLSYIFLVLLALIILSFSLFL